MSAGSGDRSGEEEGTRDEEQLLNVGFAHRPEEIIRDIRLSKMIVASTHSESGCHEDSMLLFRQVFQCDLLGFVLF
jgi:hypothetical protein